jgi:hypothetical protein
MIRNAQEADYDVKILVERASRNQSLEAEGRELSMRITVNMKENERLQHQVFTKQRETSELDTKIESQRSILVSEGLYLREMLSLRDQGFPMAKFRVLKSILAKDPSILDDFDNKMDQYGDYKSTMDAMQDRIRQLVVTEAEHEKRVSIVAAKLKGMEETLNLAGSNLKAEMELVLTGYKMQLAGLTKSFADSEASVSGVIRIFLQMMKDLDAKILEMTERIERLPQLRAFEPLAQVMSGERVDPELVRSSALMALAALQAGLPKGSTSRPHVDILADSLKSDLAFDPYIEWTRPIT